MYRERDYISTTRKDEEWSYRQSTGTIQCSKQTIFRHLRFKKGKLDFSCLCCGAEGSKAVLGIGLPSAF